MAWRIARSLDQLRSEVNARWPNRSKVSDGVIGDTAHAHTASDHNANDQNVVCAFDITHDPDNGPDIGALFDELISNPHPDLKYAIANGTIASRRDGFQPRPYHGDPHTNHIHVSVGVGGDGQSRQPYDDRDPWLTVQQEDDVLDPNDPVIKALNERLNVLSNLLTLATENAARGEEIKTAIAALPSGGSALAGTLKITGGELKVG